METHLAALRARARSLPQAPGVYFWKDGRGRTLYIGKAVNLRDRVTSYFSTARRDHRTRQLLSRARHIEYEVTGTELDALFKESALIKREQPEQNRALRTPRPAHYLKLDARLEDPYLESTRELIDDGSLYFGPFRSAAVLRETMEFLHAVLPLRKCTRVRPLCRPCLYYQMKTCAGPLVDDAHRRRHQDAIARLNDLLDGRSDRVISWLEQKRDRLSDALMFERAADIQARLDSLHRLVEKQAILDAAVRCRCVLVYEQTPRADGPGLLLVAHGHVLSRRDAAGADSASVLHWLRAHDPLIKLARCLESEVDAASVLERWLTVNRQHVRWVAVPEAATAEDLVERIRYVLGYDGSANF